MHCSPESTEFRCNVRIESINMSVHALCKSHTSFILRRKVTYYIHISTVSQCTCWIFLLWEYLLGERENGYASQQVTCRLCLLCARTQLYTCNSNLWQSFDSITILEHTSTMTDNMIISNCIWYLNESFTHVWTVETRPG